MTRLQSAESRLDGAAYTLRRAREAFEFRRSDKNRAAFEAAEDAYEDALAAFAAVRDVAHVTRRYMPAPSMQMELFA